MFAVIFTLIFSGSSHAQDLSICEKLGREQCLWALTCAKDPKNPNKVIPSDCAQYYKEPEPPPKPVEVSVPTPAPKKQKSALEQLYFIDVEESEQERIIDERSRRQAERAVDSEESKDTSPKKPEEQKPILPPDPFAQQNPY